MSENTKKVSVEKVESDSIKKIDETVKYVPGTELTLEQISKLPMGKVEMKKNTGKDRKGNPYVRYSLSLKLCDGCNYTADSFKETDFYYLAQKVFVEKLGKKLTDEEFIAKFPIRFVKGKYKNLNNEEIEYHMIQIIFKLGIVYSVFIKKSNRELDTLLIMESIGKTPKINWVEKPMEENSVLNEDGSIDYSKFE